MPDGAGTVHATCVAFGPAGLLILGPPGSGKSTLALELMAIGARLVSDDRVILTRTGDVAVASAPAAIAGAIEARGIGLLAADAQERAAIRLVVDLGRTKHDRLPRPRHMDVIGCETEVIYNSPHRGFAAAIRQYLIGGRLDGAAWHGTAD